MSIVFQDQLCSQSFVFSNCQGRKSTNYIELVDLCIHTCAHLELERLHIECWEDRLLSEFVHSHIAHFWRRIVICGCFSLSLVQLRKEFLYPIFHHAVVLACPFGTKSIVWWCKKTQFSNANKSSSWFVVSVRVQFWAALCAKWGFFVCSLQEQQAAAEVWWPVQQSPQRRRISVEVNFSNFYF